MKKIYILLISIGLLATSCKDYLEEENRSNAEESFYLTAAGYDLLLNANYSQLRDIYGSQVWLFAGGTDMYAGGREQGPVGLTTYTTLNSSSEGVAYLYDECYEAIQIANMGIYYGDITEQTDDIQNKIGQIKFLRAHAYFLLVQTYGGVSLVTDYISETVLEFERNSAEEIYDFIIAEMEESLNMVSETTYNGYVNKRAVRNFLAKVYLTRGYESFGSPSDFTTAATYADAAIAGEGLTQSFEELWLEDTDNYPINPETIFSVMYDPSSVSADALTLGNTQSTFFSSYLGGSDVAEDAPYRNYALVPTDYAIGLYEQGDERWDATFMVTVYDRYFTYYDGDITTSEVSHYYEPKWYAGSATHQTDYMTLHPTAIYHEYGTYHAAVNPNLDYETIPVKKFDDPAAPFGSSTSRRDIVIARVGEAYLTAAEAYFKAGDATTALARLNVVRERAGVPDATAAELDIDYILDERGRELLGEYYRWFDLKRTGTLVQRASMYNYEVEQANFNGANGALKILRPIPQTALDLNQNDDFEQNPAYQ